MQGEQNIRLFTINCSELEAKDRAKAVYNFEGVSNDLEDKDLSINLTLLIERQC